MPAAGAGLPQAGSLGLNCSPTLMLSVSRRKQYGGPTPPLFSLSFKTHIHTHTHNTHSCTRTHMHTHVHACTHTHTTHTHTHAHMHTRSCTHTAPCSWASSKPRSTTASTRTHTAHTHARMHTRSCTHTAPCSWASSKPRSTTASTRTHSTHTHARMHTRSCKHTAPCSWASSKPRSTTASTHTHTTHTHTHTCTHAHARTPHLAAGPHPSLAARLHHGGAQTALRARGRRTGCGRAARGGGMMGAVGRPRLHRSEGRRHQGSERGVPLLADPSLPLLGLNAVCHIKQNPTANFVDQRGKQKSSSSFAITRWRPRPRRNWRPGWEGGCVCVHRWRTWTSPARWGAGCSGLRQGSQRWPTDGGGADAVHACAAGRPGPLHLSGGLGAWGSGKAANGSRRMVVEQMLRVRAPLEDLDLCS